MNDKGKRGQATLNKWERQNDALRTLQKSIETTKNAIEAEKSKIAGIENANEITPKEILALVESGDLVQWRKHPNTFFVSGVDKARIVWDEKKKVVAHKYITQVTEPEQRSKFAKIYNGLNAVLNLPKK